MATTPFLAPDGTPGTIPTEKVQDAVKAGGKVGQWILAPDGTRGIVPTDQYFQALRAGGRPVAQQQINMQPESRTAAVLGTGAENAMKGVASATNQFMGKPEVQAAMDVLTPEMGAFRGPVENAAKSAAGNITESALHITDNMRAHAANIGEAILDNTHGIKSSTLAPEIKNAVKLATASMEEGVQKMTDAGVTGSVEPAWQALGKAIDKIPRNSKDVLDKVSSLQDLLHLGEDASKTTYTPSELLEMKRGVGDSISTWPAEWQRSNKVIGAKQAIYNAIDGELDRLVPGNAEKNGLISSLVEGKKQSARVAKGASITQQVMNKLRVPTGALIGSVGGERIGEKYGAPGAIAGTIAGAAIPTAVASTGSQMAIARLINSMGNTALTPAMLRIMSTLAGGPQKEEEQ